MLKLVILGDCPSKKNSRILTSRGGRLMSFPGANYRQWHTDASKQLLGKRKHFQADQVQVDLVFYPKTKRAGDLTNKAESIMDVLVDNGILGDDNWYMVPKISLSFGAVDPKNPRVEIEIK